MVKAVEIFKCPECQNEDNEQFLFTVDKEGQLNILCRNCNWKKGFRPIIDCSNCGREVSQLAYKFCP